MNNQDHNIAQGDSAVDKQMNDNRSTTQTQTITGNKNINAGRDVGREHHQQPTSPASTCLLPSQDEVFLHREKELTWLDKQLFPDKVVAVCGPSGMGKSALAVRAVRSLPPDRFPDGIIFHTFYHQAETSKALQTIAHALQLPREGDLQQEVAEALGSRQALLILDSAEEADDLKALLRLRGRCGVLITTRKKSDCGPLRWDLQALPNAQAQEVLWAWCGQAGDQETIKQIAELLGGRPVALRLAGHYLHSAGEPATDYLRWLRVGLLLEKAQNGKNRAVGLDGIIQHSVNQLSKEARLALEIIGVLAFAPFREGANVALLKNFNHCMIWELCRLLISLLVHRQAWLLHSTERDLRFCRKVLNELVDMGLLERQGEGWQVSHSLIYAYVHKEMFLSDVTHKLLALYYRDFFERYSKAGPEGYALLDEERVHCLQVMKSCLNREQWKEVQNLARAMREYLDQSGHWPEQLAAQKMRLTAARKSGDRHDEVTCYLILGYDCGKRGEHEQAITYYTSGLKRARELKDTKKQIVLLDGIALSYRDLDKHDQALESYQQSLSICQKTGDREKGSDILDSMGQLFEEQGNYDQALHYYKQALALKKEIGDRPREAAVLDTLGAIYQDQGQLSKAMECQEQALNIYYELGDQKRQAESLINIGFTLAALDQFARAEESMALAVEIAEALELPELDEYRDALEQVRAERQGA